MSNRYVGGYVINERLIFTNQIEYTTPGTYSWVCPENVTSVSVVCIGGGGGAGHFFGTGGGGAALAYKNNISVTPGISYTVQVGVGGAAGTNGNIGANGTSSSFTAGFGTMIAGGGEGGKGNATFTNGGAGGTYSNADGGGNGGTGGPRQTNQGGNSFAAGGGGAGGYSGNGGNGGGASGFSTYQNATAGTGGGGGGGGGWGPATNSNSDITAGGGGGTGLLGQGTSGAAGTLNSTTVRGGGGGSSGNNGATPITFNDPGTGGLYGGGGGSRGGGISIPSAGPGASGAVRIIWPGDTRTFPSANTGNLTTATSIIATSSTYASGVYRLSDYQLKVRNGLWPLFERYSFSNLNPISINEGANTTFSVNTTNVLTGTQLYWSILHNTSNSFDFITTSNTFTVTNNVGSFTVGTVADLSTEGAESFQLQIQKTNANGEIVLTSSAITLADTSLSPLPPIDFLLVGGGGRSTKPSFVYGFPGGAGGAGVLQAIGFTKYFVANTYTVTISSGNGGESSFSGPFDQTFNFSGQTLTFRALGSGTGAAWHGAPSPNLQQAASNGGGGAAQMLTSQVSGATRYNLSSISSSNNLQVSEPTYNFSNQFPGVFTNYGVNGGGTTTIGSGGTNAFAVVWASGGGGGAGGTRTSYIINGNNTNINGGNGMLSSITGTPTYYGGGGASAGTDLGGPNNQERNYFGSGGLGGGASYNQFGATNGDANLGGGGANGGTGGSGRMIFRFLDSQLSATGGSQTLDGEYRVVQFFSSGTISFARK
jgi:hypothetical protein